jgi:hypothetical protein
MLMPSAMTLPMNPDKERRSLASPAIAKSATALASPAAQKRSLHAHLWARHPLDWYIEEQWVDER